MDNLNEQLGEYFGVRDGEGVLVTEVLEDTPAEKAGLKAGDVIIEIDDDDIEETGDVVNAIGDKDPGDMVNIVVLRDRKTITFDFEVGERDDKSFGNFNFRVPDVDIDLSNFTWFKNDEDDDDDHKLHYYFKTDKHQNSLKDFSKQMKHFNKELKEMEYEKDHSMKKELDELKKELQELRELIED